MGNTAPSRKTSQASEPPRRSTRIAMRKQSEARSPQRPSLHQQLPASTKTRKRKQANHAVESPQAYNKKLKKVPSLSGLWSLLPQELLDGILEMCTCKQLAMLETTSSYFKSTKIIESVAELRLKAIPRAKGMMPNPEAHEKYTSLLHFVLSQSAAAAQATAVAFGANHTAALLISKEQDGDSGHHSLYTFGRGWHGQLGHRDYEMQPKPKLLCIGYQPSTEYPEMMEEITPAVVAAGSDYTASITRRGQLLSFGLGSRGELGHELPSAEVPYPMRSILASRPNVRIVSVACGASHTLAISEQGSVFSCGRNQDGQLGNASFLDGMQLQPVVGIRGQRVVSCAAGASHSLALASDGSLYSWGSGKFGQLGHSSLQAVYMIAAEQAIVLASPQKIAVLEPANLKPWERITSIAAGAHHACAVTVGGTMLMFGCNTHGQLGTNDKENRWRPTEVSISTTGEPNHNYRTVQVVCGSQHTLALMAHKGRVTPYSTGNNTFGQLGNGDLLPLRSFKPIRSLVPLNVVALQAGDHSSAAMTENGDVFLWGRNDNHQLGLGDDNRCVQRTQQLGIKPVCSWRG
eukprot:GHUV01038130.1.p1 GENE.GHUV01038130.1~~GHUV01038130.1.p1  ORF type:complete len:576 (+),score=117.41 GHUV01038130.1:80-1807(+)